MIETSTPSVTIDRLTEVTSDLGVADLLHDFSELTGLLDEQIDRGNWLDAFLLAAGMSQVVDDYAHRDFSNLAKVAHHVRRFPRIGPAAAWAVERARWIALAVRNMRPATGRIESWAGDFKSLLLGLAEIVAADQTTLEAPEMWHEVLRHARPLPRDLQKEVLRLPSCFRSLDLQPADVAALTAQFAARWPERAQPVLVVGIRTSGSYLGPLHVAGLKRLGFARVSWISVRPGHELSRGETRMLATAARDGAMAVIVDDPPSSGATVLAAAAILGNAGFPDPAIVLSLPLQGDVTDLPAALRRYPALLLDRRDWAIEQQLDPRAVCESLNEMLDRRFTVRGVAREPLVVDGDPRDDWSDRRHVRALFTASVQDATGRRTRRFIYAKGTGLGYFGRHSSVVANHLRDHIPAVYGAKEGIQFREWRPRHDSPRRTPANVSLLAASVASYTICRHDALPATRDLSVRLVGRQAVWQRVADLLAAPLGRSRLVFRSRIHDLARQALVARTPSVVDGSMAVRNWFASSDRARMLKVDFDERAYSNEDIYCYDHEYDLASAAASMRAEFGDVAARTLRETYESSTGRRIDPERWYLYQLLTLRLERRALRDHFARLHEVARPDVVELLDRLENALESVQREYIVTRCLHDVVSPAAGPLCAIDIDGTLESSPLGFTAIGPAGALALRALFAHGYRPVLASGRSLEEVRARCDAFGLPAGVAEYGLVAYVRGGNEVIGLISASDRKRLDRLRSVLGEMVGVWIDSRYRYAVRAYELDARGSRRALRPETVQKVMSQRALASGIRPIQGWSQTDFVPIHAEKADGLRAAAARIGGPGSGPLLALAVGDSASDLSMLAAAKHAYGPANSTVDLVAGGVAIVRGSGPMGLATAVGRIIGHQPGACGLCRLPDPGAVGSRLFALLNSYDERGWRRLRLLRGL